MARNDPNRKFIAYLIIGMCVVTLIATFGHLGGVHTASEDQKAAEYSQDARQDAYRVWKQEHATDEIIDGELDDEAPDFEDIDWEDEDEEDEEEAAEEAAEQAAETEAKSKGDAPPSTDTEASTPAAAPEAPVSSR